jgi:hypothetical protein
MHLLCYGKGTALDEEDSYTVILERMEKGQSGSGELTLLFHSRK